MKTCLKIALPCVLLACGSNVPPRTSDLAKATVDSAVTQGSALGAKGPFEIGFTYLRFVDSTRVASDGTPGRPVTVFLWYPVDPRSITSSSPEASYPLEAVYDRLPHAPSSAFEREGIDRAWQDAPPSSKGPFPLFAFSVGMGLDAPFYVYLDRIASHGFAVAVVSHDGDPTFFGENVDGPGVSMMNRPLDLSFAITRLLDDSRSPRGPRHGLIIPGLVAAGGHSLGGYAALALAAGDDNVCDPGIDELSPPPATCIAIERDPRVRAVVHFEGTNEALKFSELARIRIPAMGIGETPAAVELTCGIPVCESYDARPHAAISASTSYRVDVAHAHHLALSNVCATMNVLKGADLMPPGWTPDFFDFLFHLFCASPNDMLGGDTLIDTREAYRLLDGYTTAFLEAHLARDLSANAFLTPEWAAANEPNVQFFTTEQGGDQHAGPGLSYVNPEWHDQFDWYWSQPAQFPRR